jgi:hypothetical protein
MPTKLETRVARRAAVRIAEAAALIDSYAMNVDENYRIGDVYMSPSTLAGFVERFAEDLLRAAEERA